MSEISQRNFDEISNLQRSSSNREIRQAFRVLATNSNFYKHREISENPTDMLTRKFQPSSDKENVYDKLLQNISTNDHKPNETVKLEEKCGAPECQYTNNNHITPDNLRRKEKTDGNQTTNGVLNDSKHRIRVTYTNIRYNPFTGDEAEEAVYCFLSNYGYIRGFSYKYGLKPEAIVDYQYRSAAEFAIDKESKYQNKYIKLEWENGPPPASDDPVDGLNLLMFSLLG
ncbi:hypothetical protein WA026_014440 [Henosepilachna vigintioctopunctata]|uniref:J domain-containing protein n=1 Tax=Henosepilachna vigintioctopunctata TaxID=420089 RepID=A0AAW1UBL8_9CUCU